MTDTATPDTPAARRSLFERAIILSLTLTRLGTRRTVSTSAVEVDTDKTLLHVSKEILDSDNLEAIQRLDGELRDLLKQRGLPSPLKHGCYLIPLDLVQQTDTEITEFFTRRTALVETFLATYGTKVQEAQARLDTLFDAGDYPTIDKVRAAFSASFQYLTIDVPGHLQGISRTLFEREAEKAQQRIAAVEDEIVQVLRLSLKELVDHMVDRLQPGPDNKPKVFRNTLVTNMTEFLETFKARNLTNDQEMETLVDQAKTILAGVDPQTLRNSADTRQHVHHQMQTIKQALDAMVVAKPTRHFAFHDDDAAPATLAATAPAPTL